MLRFLRPLTRAVTYTRWVHMIVGAVPTVIGSFVVGVRTDSPAHWLWLGLLPVPLVAAAGLVPAMRLAEGLQARLMLFPGRHARQVDGAAAEPVIVARPAQTWRDRVVTALWMVLRLQAGGVMAYVSVQAAATALTFLGAALGDDPGADSLITVHGGHWAYVFLVPLPLLLLVYVSAGAGALMARAALHMLGPSPRRTARGPRRTHRATPRTQPHSPRAARLHRPCPHGRRRPGGRGTRRRQPGVHRPGACRDRGHRTRGARRPGAGPEGAAHTG